MWSLKTKAASILLCIAILIGVSPVQAAEKTKYVTREQAIASLLNTVGYGALIDAESDLRTFADAGSISKQFTDELAKAVTNGIIKGDSQKKLAPKRSITKLEFAVIISRTIHELPIIKPNKAFNDVPTTLSEEVGRVVRAGIISGKSLSSFGSKDYMTQDQIASVLSKIKQLSAVRTQDDFYYAINSSWLKNTKLPAGYSYLMSFEEVTLANNNKMKSIVNDLVKNEKNWQDGTKEQKMADFYSTIVDVQNRNKQGIEPIKPYLNELDSVKTVQELLDISAKFENEIGINPLFSFSADVDLKDSRRYSLYGSGLSTVLPGDYMLAENPQVKTLYTGFIANMFKLSGSADESAQKSAQDIYNFEKLIAGATLSNEEASKIENMYNPVKTDELAAMFKEADIKSYMDKLGYGSVDNIVLTDPGLMKKTGELISDENLEVLKAYVRYHFVLGSSQYLSSDLENAMISFNNAFLGISGTMSAEDKAFDMLNSVMSGYMSRMYVEKYFSDKVKKDVTGMINEIIATYEKRIQKLDWMASETKAAAIAKLKAMKIKVGYPDSWEDDMKDISIKSYNNGGSLIENIFAVTSASAQYSKKLLSQSVDKSKWSMAPQTVNACYNPTSNDITIPAGILQAPFYDVKAPREQNLGGIGSIIAHEITHAFDNNGAQFDKDGNMKNWWTEKDYATFKQKCQNVVKLYDNLYIAPNAHVNGNLTVSENVADIGSMACILDILKGMKNPNYKKLFESNAKIWHMTASEQTYQLLATQDVHSPNKYRVNQVIRNFKEFYNTYGVKPGDAMYLAPEKRVTIW